MPAGRLAMYVLYCEELMWVVTLYSNAHKMYKISLHYPKPYLAYQHPLRATPIVHVL
jgi:hypothetical protein